MKRLAEIYRYRELLKNLVVTELKLRYRRSALGFLWTLLNPLLMMLVLTVVFSTVMRFDIKDYSVLLFAGLLPWTFLSQSITLSITSIVSKGDLLKKVYVPPALIRLAAVSSNLINFLFAFTSLLLVVLALGHPLTPALLFLPVSLGLLTLFTVGFALLFSCLNVFFRDFSHMTEVLLSAWFYASPIIFPLALVPEQYRGAFALNPFSHFVECFRAPIYAGALPAWSSVLSAGVASVVALVVGATVFFRFERRFIFWV